MQKFCKFSIFILIAFIKKLFPSLIIKSIHYQFVPKRLFTGFNKLYTAFRDFHSTLSLHVEIHLYTHFLWCEKIKILWKMILTFPFHFSLSFFSYFSWQKYLSSNVFEESFGSKILSLFYTLWQSLLCDMNNLVAFIHISLSHSAAFSVQITFSRLLFTWRKSRYLF